MISYRNEGLHRLERKGGMVFDLQGGCVTGRNQLEGVVGEFGLCRIMGGVIRFWGSLFRGRGEDVRVWERGDLWF